MKYKDDEQKDKKVCVISSAQHKWKDITSIISKDANTMSALETKYSDPNDCCRQVFLDYFINCKPETYSQDWKGVIELLEDVNLKTLAEEVKKAVTRTTLD